MPAITSTPIRPPLPDPTQPLRLDPFEPVIERVFRMADEHADAPAAVRDDVSWSYAHLRLAARALATELGDLGVEPGDAVAVTGIRSHGLLTAVLAVLARNAILVPLDPMVPSAGRRAMLEHAGARLLIEAGEPERASEIPLAGLDVRRFSIPSVPTVDDAGRARADAYRPFAIDGNDPAYVLFTSGTTGEPKGIVGRQRGLSHFLAWEREATGIGPGDRAALLTGLSFDVVLRDLFLPLTSGAALHLPPFAPGATPPSDVLEFLARDRVTLVHAVPTIATFWLADAPDGLALPDLRWVLFAGEPLPGALVRRWRARFGTERIGNLYGPTETTLAKCFAEIGPEPEPGIQPVGRAIPGAQALVMDGDRLCGPDEPGEIVIRTPYASLGYLGAEGGPRGRAGDPRPPFVHNPFTRDPADLVYRTGDRGRYRADGTLEIHGRLDDQVKILGVRIEPSEVAATIAAHPRVRAATVTARPDPNGDTALVAYHVPVTGGVDEGVLRAYVGDRLLPAKVPRLFVALDALPRTPNGKVDTRALPEPDWDGRGAAASLPPASAATGTGNGAAATAGDGPQPSADDAASPGSPSLDEATATLVDIFRELLRTPGVGPDDDFFRLGGHSLLAARLIQRVQHETGVRIQVRSLFSHRTPRGLASVVVAGGDRPRRAAGATRTARQTPAVAAPTARPTTRSTHGASHGAVRSAPADPSAGPSIHWSYPPEAGLGGAAAHALVPIQPGGTRAPLFVVPGLGSRILFLRFLADRLGADQPLFALHTRLLDDGSVYERIEDLAAVHVRAVRGVQPHGPYRVLGFSYGGLVALEVARQLRAAGEDVAFIGIVDTRLPGLRQHGSWSVPRSIPRRLLNLAAILQPLSGASRRTYLRTRLRVALQSGRAHAVEWLHGHLPRILDRLVPGHPYGPEEIEWLGADREAWGRYEPRPYPGVITYFWAQHSQRPPSVYDHREGWAAVAEGGLDVRPIPGNHLTVMAEPLVRSTARAIREALERADAADGPTDLRRTG